MYGVLAMLMAFVLVIGVLQNVNVINSKAAEETEEEYDENDYEVNLEVKKAVRDIKERYQIKETIDNLELLKATLEKNEDYSEEGFEKIIAETNEDVIVEFCIKEAYNNMININNLAEKLNKCIMSDTEEIPNDIEYIAYSNGDFEATKTVTNEFGTKSTVKIVDEEVDDTRKWHKRAEITGKAESIGYTERRCTYTYEHKMLGLPCFKQTVSFTLKYKSSKDGLKAISITDNGTKSTLWWTKLKITSKEINDSVATHIGANVDGTVIAHFTVLEAGKIGGIDIPAGMSYNFKVNFWLTLKEWNKSKKTMKVKKGGTVYVDSLSILTE